MHAHISIKQASKMQNGNEKQIKVRLKSNLWIFIFMFMSFAKNCHASGMMLKCLNCQQLRQFNKYVLPYPWQCMIHDLKWKLAKIYMLHVIIYFRNFYWWHLLTTQQVKLLQLTKKKSSGSHLPQCFNICIAKVTNLHIRSNNVNMLIS